MSVTAQKDLLSGLQIKYGTNHSSISSPDSVLESQIAKSLLSEKSTTDAVNDFKTVSGTGNLTFNPSNNYLASVFDKSNIQPILNNDLRYRNIAVVANYVSNEDTNDYAYSQQYIHVNSTTNQSVNNYVLDDSSAYANTTARINYTDPYWTSPTFGDSDENYTCTFDTTNATKFVSTRNVNTNSAHSNGLPSITAQEHVDWNTQGELGSFFVNGSVSIDSTTGEPTATYYAGNDPLNLIANDFSVELVTGNSNVVPIFGRYHVTFSASSGSSVTVTPTGNNELVVTSDLTSWSNFLIDLDTNVPLDYLPNSIATNDLSNWVLPDNFVATGFTLRLSADDFTSTLTLNGNNNYDGPFDFNLENMNFSPKSTYILEKSMEESASNGFATLDSSVTINGDTYSNLLTITNGSLSLESTSDVNSGYFVLVDGVENLGLYDYNTNGSISVYDSSITSNYTDTESSFPRASRPDVSLTNEILDSLSVQYNINEPNYQSDVGVLTGTNLTAASVTFAVTTMVGQTNSLAGADNWTNIIDVNNSAIAIVRDTNSSIANNEITFFSNSNTYANNNNDKLSVIDIVCNKAWSESKVYSSADGIDTEIPGITVDVKSTNMSSVNFDLRDIRLVLSAKTVSDLNLSSSNNTWSLNCFDAYLTTSVGKMGIIDDSTIVDLLLNGNDNDTHTINVDFKPHNSSVLANKFTKFHNQIEITYDDVKQITYDDEFEVLNYSKSSVTTSPEITDHLNVPANTKLYKRSYDETFNIRIPFRLGNYNNLYLTTPLITQTVEYYVLTDNNNNNADLPRYFINGIKNASNVDIYATITSTIFSTTITFSNKDLKPHFISLEKITNDSWNSVSPSSPVHCDFWYNSISTVTSTIGTFNVSFTLSPDVTSVEVGTFYVDLELDKGTSSFTISGKNFTEAEIDAMSSVDLNTFSLSSVSSGTSITGLGDVTYLTDAPVPPNTQASTTLSAAGYVFKIDAELYLSIRIFICPNGMFKCVKTSDGTVTTTYPNIQYVDGEPSLILDTGVNGYSGLLSAIRNTSFATWSLKNDAISATYYGETGFSYERISTLNQEFLSDEGARGFKTTVLRGLTADTTTTIYRTPSTYVLDMAGYQTTGDLYADIYNLSIFDEGTGVTMSTNSDALSMYSTDFGTQTWNLNATFGYYTLSDTVDSTSTPISTSVPTYRTVISDRRGLKIISRSLNTYEFTYEIQFTSSNTLTVRHNPDIDAVDYSVNSSGYTFVDEFSPDNLRDGEVDNVIGNILNIHYDLPGAIPTLTCQFSICPPYLIFNAINPDDVSSLPFNSLLVGSVTRFLRVENINNYTSGNYYPFSDHSYINNIKFVQNNVRQYLDYVLSSSSTVNGMNIDNYKIEVKLSPGLYSQETDGNYETFYPSTTITTSPITTVDGKTQITSSNGELTVKLNQQLHSTFSNFFVYDETFAEYNLQFQLGSTFISDINSYGVTFYLEFLSGDCTRLDTYTIETIETTTTNTDSDELLVTFAKYSHEAGIDNTFLHRNTANGFSIPWTDKYTVTISVPLNSDYDLTETTTTFHDFLDSLKLASSSSQFENWTYVENPSSTLPKMALVPCNTIGADKLKNFVILTPQIPRSLLVLQMEDQQRMEDNYKIPNYRVNYSGNVFSSCLNISPSIIRIKGNSEANSYLTDRLRSSLPTTSSI